MAQLRPLSSRGHTWHTTAPPGRVRGTVYTLAAELLWGTLPVYFLLLTPTGPLELVAWRISLAFVFCALLLTVTRKWSTVVSVFRRPRLLALTAFAGAVIYANWQTYMIGTLTGQVIETSLGYFISPIFTVLLGVVVLRERLRLLAWIAVGVAGGAVVVIIVGYGSFPWLALVLAATFAVYGLVKKQIGPSVDAINGLALESLWLLPVAAVQLSIVANTTGVTFGDAGLPHALLLLSVGAATAVPLLLFAAGARHVPLTVIGLIQFTAPVLQFSLGFWVLGETMTPERWIGFCLVWTALALLTVDSVLASRNTRRDLPESGERAATVRVPHSRDSQVFRKPTKRGATRPSSWPEA